MSTEPHFLLDAVPGPGQFVLDGAEGRHAATVRRMRSGEALVLTDGRGTRCTATVLEVGRGSLTLEVAPAELVPAPRLRVVLVQALPKGERSDLAVDLATEAGVDAIVPWQAARCVARWSGDKSGKADKGVQKWQAVAREAAKQSRRSWVPEIRPLASTAQVAELISNSAAGMLLHEAGAVRITDVPLPAAGDLVLVVGPEGGIAPEELEALAVAGAVTVRLGHEVLRTSTAASVALGALGVLTDRWV